MGECIICGTSTEGHICDSHQEDAVFEFKGNRPDQLTPGRFYQVTVDGYAEFGVFVDLSDRVTGLLHRSKLDKRLESLDWEVGDNVYVQVTNIRDNGDVDLGWSIRQSERDFRGVLVQEPDGDRMPGQADQKEPESEQEDEAEMATESEPQTANDPEPATEPEVDNEPEPDTEAEAKVEAEAEHEDPATGGETSDLEPESEAAASEITQVSVAELR